MLMKTPIPENETTVAGFAKEQLVSFLERAERLREEKKGIEADLKDLFAEAKSTGFDVPAIKEILKDRAADPAARAEHEAIVELYKRAIGMPV